MQGQDVDHPGARRSPQGERGLKSKTNLNRWFSELSLSARRAWIEMIMTDEAVEMVMVALRKESVD